MAFSANPLALSVPDPSFDSWLRDNNYLDILDQRTSDLHNLSVPPATAADSSSAAATSTTNGFLSSPFSYLKTLLSLFTINPISKLSNEDFTVETPSWTLVFIGLCDSYSFPSSPAQARLRVHENVKRYARNYAYLFILFSACSLYQLPIALVGLISSLAVWEFLKFCSEYWGMDQRPVLQQIMVHVAQCVTAVILLWSNVQTALIWTLGVSYAVMLFHASFRKLTPTKVVARK